MHIRFLNKSRDDYPRISQIAQNGRCAGDNAPKRPNSSAQGNALVNKPPTQESPEGVDNLIQHEGVANYDIQGQESKDEISHG